jgi:hypothetical protein
MNFKKKYNKTRHYQIQYKRHSETNKMIELKRCNYFTGDITPVSNAVSSIVKFLELDGKNPILFTPPKPIDSKGKITNLIYYISPNITWENFEDFKSKIENPANRFRVNLLIFDFWSLSRNEISKYKELIDEFKIDHIIVAKEYSYKDSDNVADYHVKGEYKDLSTNSSGGYMATKSEIWVTNKVDNWTASLDSLKTEYIRDKKIDDIFKK